jgi:hypothetical protein
VTMLTVEPRPMAKDRGESVRLDSDLLRKARIVAAIRNVSLTAYLFELLDPQVSRDHIAAIASEAKGGKAPGRGKG